MEAKPDKAIFDDAYLARVPHMRAVAAAHGHRVKKQKGEKARKRAARKGK